MLTLPSQRVTLANSGLMTAEWFRSFADWLKDYNRKTVTRSATASSVTATTDSTQVATVSIPAINTGSVRLTLAISCTNNVNDKTVTVKLGTTVIQTITIDASTDTQSAQILILGRTGSTQYTSPVSLINCTGSGGIATTENLTANNTIAVFMQLGTITDTITLESMALELEQA